MEILTGGEWLNPWEDKSRIKVIFDSAAQDFHSQLLINLRLSGELDDWERLYIRVTSQDDGARLYEYVINAKSGPAKTVQIKVAEILCSAAGKVVRSQVYD